MKRIVTVLGMVFMSSTVFAVNVLAENKHQEGTAVASCNEAAIMDAGMLGGASFPHIQLIKNANGMYNLYFSQNEVYVEANPSVNLPEIQIDGVKNFLIAEGMTCEFSTMKEAFRCVQKDPPYGEINFRKISTYGVYVKSRYRLDDKAQPMPLDTVEVEISTHHLENTKELQAIRKNKRIKSWNSGISLQFSHWNKNVCTFSP